MQQKNNKTRLTRKHDHTGTTLDKVQNQHWAIYTEDNDNKKRKTRFTKKNKTKPQGKAS